MNHVSSSSVPVLRHAPERARLTTTHPHGSVICRADGRLALLRISKNASTELMNRLNCTQWHRAEEVDSPIVLFLREPSRRFLSSIGETLLRVQHPGGEDQRAQDRVIVSEDVYGTLADVISRPVPDIIDAMLELIEECPFDAHHEPQASFFTRRDGSLRFDAWAYTVEDLEGALGKIAARHDVPILAAHAPGNGRHNVGGAKPVTGSTRLRALARRLTRSGLYRVLPVTPLLALRYGEPPGSQVQRRELNAMANRLTGEVKTAGLSEGQVVRVRRIYQRDIALWSRVSEADDRCLSEVY